MLIRFPGSVASLALCLLGLGPVAARGQDAAQRARIDAALASLERKLAEAYPDAAAQVARGPAPAPARAVPPRRDPYLAPVLADVNLRLLALERRLERLGRPAPGAGALPAPFAPKTRARRPAPAPRFAPAFYRPPARSGADRAGG